MVAAHRASSAKHTTRFTTPSDKEIVSTRVVDAPRHLVWQAWTKPEHVSKWLLGPEGWTMPICEIDLRPGGRWRYVYRKASGTEMTLTGSVREVVPPERLVTTESWGPEWPETVNTLVLTEADGRTTITLTIAYPSKEAREAALGTGAMEGMNRSFERLEDLLAAER
jgi:uncharacterized protein YndB with AHSA1/START domain